MSARFAGAMRGAVSVALVYYYYDPDGKTYNRQRSTLIAMTLAVVLISTLFFGAVTKPLLDLLLGPDGTSSLVTSSHANGGMYSTDRDQLLEAGWVSCMGRQLSWPLLVQSNPARTHSSQPWQHAPQQELY